MALAHYNRGHDNSVRDLATTLKSWHSAFGTPSLSDLALRTAAIPGRHPFTSSNLAEIPCLA